MERVVARLYAPGRAAGADQRHRLDIGAGGLQYIFARDPNLDPLAYKPEDHADRVRQVSALMDSTNPHLSAFRAHGGKLIMLEHMSDYAQSPYAGIGYFQSVGARMGAEATHEFMRLYTAPGADHVGAAR